MYAGLSLLLMAVGANQGAKALALASCLPRRCAAIPKSPSLGSLPAGGHENISRRYVAVNQSRCMEQPKRSEKPQNFTPRFRFGPRQGMLPKMADQITAFDQFGDEAVKRF